MIFCVLKVAINEPLFWNGRRTTEVTRVTRGWGTLPAVGKKKGGQNPQNRITASCQTIPQLLNKNNFKPSR